MQEYEKAIRERLSRDRMEHVLAVRVCAAELAAIHGVEQKDAALAGCFMTMPGIFLLINCSQWPKPGDWLPVLLRKKFPCCCMGLLGHS